MNPPKAPKTPMLVSALPICPSMLPPIMRIAPASAVRTPITSRKSAATMTRPETLPGPWATEAGITHPDCAGCGCPHPNCAAGGGAGGEAGGGAGGVTWAGAPVDGYCGSDTFPSRRC